MPALRTLASCLLLLAPSLGCGDDGAPPDASRDASVDSGRTDGGRVDAGRRDAGPETPWPRTLPPMGSLGDRRGRTVARANIHLHSPYSHDACDGEGFVDGALADRACLMRLRAALCDLHVDAAMLTDHAPHLNEIPFAEATLLDEAQGDEAVRGDGGEVVANRMACPSGHRVLVTVGAENPLMPVMFRAHLADPADPTTLGDAYDADGPDAVAAFRAAGALVFQNHPEDRTLDGLRDLGLDGLEIFNTHSAMDPRIRVVLELETAQYAEDLVAFGFARNGLTPDLLGLVVVDRQAPNVDKWDALLAEGQALLGIAGNDAHENVLGTPLSDGDRPDSYRRMMRWSSNHLLVDSLDLEGYEEALRARRSYVAFEVVGTPVGFDFVAQTSGGVAEMGDTVPTGAVLRVTAPRLPADHPADPAPAVRLRLLRSAADGAVEVAIADAGELTHVADAPGAYRAEVLVTPHHAGPYLGRLADRLVREIVWVYSNPIHVRAP